MATPKWNKKRKLWIIDAKNNGKRKSFYSATPGKTGMNEVIKKYNEWIEFGGIENITVEKCVELFLKDIEHRLGKKDTYRQTELYSRLYIIPAVGDSKINKLTLRDWQNILNEAKPTKNSSKELSHKTVSNIRSIIVALHKFAYENYYCDEWRGSLYIPKGHHKGERQILQPKDIEKLFEPSDDWFINLYRVSLLCGLRPGECLGIKDEDLGDGVLYIRRAINDENEITEGKNKNAHRVVPLPEMAKKLIEETIERNKKNKLRTKWIFCHTDGNYAKQDTVRKHYKALGLPGSPYSLRHTFISIVGSQTQLAEGTIKDIVGHSESMPTYDGPYKHRVDGELESAAEIINLTFERLKNGESTEVRTKVRT